MFVDLGTTQSKRLSLLHEANTRTSNYNTTSAHMFTTIIQERVLSAECAGIGELGGKQAPGGSGEQTFKGGDAGEAGPF